MANMANLDSRKTLEQRQEEVTAKLKDKLGEKFEAVNGALVRQMLVWSMLPMVVGPELAQEVWAVWRDTADAEVQNTIGLMDKVDAERAAGFKNMFR
jgi:hypothetical protein